MKNSSMRTLLQDWQILDLAPGESMTGKILSGDEGWIPAKAPGDTYLALHRAGRIAHPFAEDNEAACKWVREREWWWRTTLHAEPALADERVLLLFEGLDTYATVWLDGVELASSANMFTPLQIDVGHRLAEGKEHVLLVRFTPPSSIGVDDSSMPTWPFVGEAIKRTKRNFHRKAQFGWGWDWGPDLPTVGIWRPASLVRQQVAALEDVCFRTLSLGPTARAEVIVVIDGFSLARDAVASVRVCLHSPSGSCVAEVELPVAAGQLTARAELEIGSPELWWTPELGAPSLYGLEVELRTGSRKLDSRSLQVGIRNIELDTSEDPDEPGCNFFRFVLNGVPLFARGANWIPASSFVGELAAADYETQLKSMAEANMNMVRVWGGGIYEHEAFYDACDRLGILVWQDFMFACAAYPEHEDAFVQNVRREAKVQITRLRNHACLALWCGNNEGHAMHELFGRFTGNKLAYLGNLYFENILPDAVRKLDPGTPYRPGSPYGEPSHNSMRAGDVHNWTVWHGMPPVPNDIPVGNFDQSPSGVAYSHYADDRGRFVSEFGIQSAPARATLEHWISGQELALGSPALLNRIKDHPKDKVNAMLLPVTGLPKDLDQYIEYTQLVQAEGLKFGIEHYRRRKPHCSGTLIWQHNDCWPCVSWSLVDYEGIRKASWYYVARAYAPVMGSFQRLESGEVELWVSNDTLHAVSIEAAVTMMTFTGKLLRGWRVSGTAPANASAVVWRGSPDAIGQGPDRVLCVRSHQFPGNELLFAPLKQLALPDLEPEMRTDELPDGTLKVELKGRSYHHFVHLVARDAATFSDNYFNLLPGEIRVVRVQAKQPLVPADVNLRVLGSIPSAAV